jgi:para-nitrobenzyl esterase
MSDQSPPVAEVASGKLRGTIIEGIAAFKAIPYAAPPTGNHRFLPPREPEPWQGIRDAIASSGRAPQAGLRSGTRPELETFSGAPDTSPDSEDCLTLHVWTPNVVDGAKRPVMVWLHGGAFSYGSANSDRLRGSRLAKRGDVVVVTVNHRLNIFGHLDLAEVGGTAYAHSGNAGVLDLVAALKWVRVNIARFGGDPENVTIFGESGGGGKVSTLLAMPTAIGLFHRAIIQSGAAVRLRTKDRALKLTEIVLRELGITSAALEQLQTLSVTRLLAAIKPAERALGPSPYRLFDRYPFGPVVDGDVLPGHPFDPEASGLMPDIPLIIGDMKDETASFLAPDDLIWHRSLTEAQMVERIRAIAGDDTNRVVETYRRLHPNASPADRLIAMTTDANFRIRSLVLAQRRAATAKAPVWMYSFNWETPLHDGKMKSPHAMDVPFTFDTIDLTNATDGGEAAVRLARTMSGVWATFARHGVPDHASIPYWPPYKVPERATLILDATCRVENDPGGETRALWQDIRQYGTRFSRNEYRVDSIGRSDFANGSEVDAAGANRGASMSGCFDQAEWSATADSPESSGIRKVKTGCAPL